jgi:hypothetical protein
MWAIGSLSRELPAGRRIGLGRDAGQRAGAELEFKNGDGYQFYNFITLFW